MFEPLLVSFSAQSGCVNLVGAGIVVASNDHKGVHIAAEALAADLGRVTRREPSPVIKTDDITYDTTLAAGTTQTDTAIIIGTIESSSLIRTLIDQKLINVDAIAGKWECFTTCVVKDAPHVSSRGGGRSHREALVIAGSDKRGAIFGVYTLAEQIGVSPWHWWADVPVRHHHELYALPRIYSSSEPSVKYRGLFINDEAPALTGLVLEKFGSYGKEFYSRVFDLLLRLKANFMWPAMWPGYPNPGSSFFVDDNAANQKLANDYGIVMSTSHHEPMQRATNEWFEDNQEGSWSWLTNKEKITEFFGQGIKRAEGLESYFTMGMRGEYDRSMKTDDPAGVVKDVIRTQRALIKKHYGQEDAVPQVLALYKEVQEYYDAGNLNVPDDVTLLFSDDNFGSIRRLPKGAERDRKGGAGIYYHFEYVGTPRSYKWIHSSSLGKTWHQLREAHRRHARQIWVFNVGDIKPMEVALTFAMALAWDIDSIPANDFGRFYRAMADREFGGAGTGNSGTLDTTTNNISGIVTHVARAWHTYDRLVSVRRHEHIESTDFSLLHYNEANRIESEWHSLLTSAQQLYDTHFPLIPEGQQDENPYRTAFFELVLHPIKASCTYTALRTTQARNTLWALQRRNTANAAARKVLDLFDADFALSTEFHSILDGKWNHIMRQTHYGFYPDTWHAPSRDMISGLSFVQSRQDSNPLVGQLGVAVEGHAGVRPGVCNEESDRTHPSRRDLVPGVTLGVMTPYGPAERWFELYTRGTKTLDWTVTTTHAWVQVSASNGRLVPGQPDVRVIITIEWDRVPEDFDREVLVEVRTTGGDYGPYYQDDFEQIHLPIRNRRVDTAALSTGFTGFVEADGYVCIPAVQPSEALPAAYYILPEVSRLGLGSVAINPSTTTGSSAEKLAAGNVPALAYDFYVWETPEAIILTLYFNMTLDLDPDHPMKYEVEIDGRPVVDEQLHQQLHRLVQDPATKGELPPGWYNAVQDLVWKPCHDLGVLKTGNHRLQIRLLHPNMMLEKLFVDLGGVKPSYLGPPPSMRLIEGGR